MKLSNQFLVWYTSTVFPQKTYVPSKNVSPELFGAS